MPLVEPGRKAPPFTSKDQDGAAHRLRDFAGRTVVLYFYPKDDTSGCTKEACAFRDQHPEFSKMDAVVLGVSPDSEKSHRKFVDKHDLPFTLLADVAPEGGEPPICAAYGVWQEKSMYGRTYMGVVRTTYLIGPDGKVVRRWDKVKVPGHAEEVLEAVRAVPSA
jgi:peroxiredoxin Q/BCP